MPRDQAPTRENPIMLDDRGQRVRVRPLRAQRRSLLFRLIRALLILGVFSGLIAGCGVLWFLHAEGRTPREWAPYLDRRAQGHRWSIVDGTALVTGYLTYADRLRRPPGGDPPANIGASPARSGPMTGRVRAVASQADLTAAIGNAQPGDVIHLLPGRYVFEGRQISAHRPGLPHAPITVRAEHLGDVVIETNMGVTFKVFAPHWQFENLLIRGVCWADRYCEHAFHIVQGARGTVIRNNRLEDLNAAIKVNGQKGEFPDDGQIIGNSFVLTRPRDTENPITPIDIVAASNWRIALNFIADFARAGGGKPTYGAFVKGAGERNVFEQNVVFCEWKLRGPGQRVGLSLGGGGTGAEYARDDGRQGFEQSHGVIRDNLIAFCSDVGIYLNKASRSVVEHNTLIDTAGIDVRFPGSSADIVANLVDGAMRPRDGGLLRDRGNDIGPLLGLFLGYHPVRERFRDPAALDFGWKDPPKLLGPGAGRPDLCGFVRKGQVIAGAFDEWGRCR